MKSPLNEFTFEVAQDSFNDQGREYEQILVVAQHKDRKFTFARKYQINHKLEEEIDFREVQKVLTNQLMNDIFDHSTLGKKISYPIDTYPYRVEIGEWNHETEKWEFDDELTITI